MTLEIKNLYGGIEGKEILKGIDLEIKPGEIHVLMGPNGSGKSTLSNIIMGNPKYKLTNGEILFDGENINKFLPDKRARLGLFLSFQYPSEIPGVTVSSFLRTAYNSTHNEKMPVKEFIALLKEKAKMLKMPKEFLQRYLNEGFSGGEKKRNEILQLAVLSPKIAILDETDSGLDIDALKTISEGIKNIVDANVGILLITHYQRILKYITPNKVHVMMDGKIVKSGGRELANELENKGYDWIKEEVKV